MNPLAKAVIDKGEKFLSKENETKLCLNSEDSHDKWCVNNFDVKKPWVKFMLKSPLKIRAYALKTANDAPSRNPTEWQISVVKAGDGVYDTMTVIHEVSESNNVVMDNYW